MREVCSMQFAFLESFPIVFDILPKKSSRESHILSVFCWITCLPLTPSPLIPPTHKKKTEISQSSYGLICNQWNLMRIHYVYTAYKYHRFPELKEQTSKKGKKRRDNSRGSHSNNSPYKVIKMTAVEHNSINTDARGTTHDAFMAWNSVAWLGFNILLVIMITLSGGTTKSSAFHFLFLYYIFVRIKSYDV